MKRKLLKIFYLKAKNWADTFALIDLILIVLIISLLYFLVFFY